MEVGRGPEQRAVGQVAQEGPRGESLEALAAGPGRKDAVALPAPLEAQERTRYSFYDYRLAKDFLKDGREVFRSGDPNRVDTYYLLPGGAVWFEQESLLEAPENGYSLKQLDTEKLLEDGPEAVIQALREQGILPLAVHSPKWFDHAFEGMHLPESIRRVSESLCRAYGIGGTADPAYIANLVAKGLGLGDGRGQFYSGPEGTPSWRIEKIKEISIGAAVGHLNEVLAEAGHHALNMVITDFWWCNCPSLDGWRSSVVPDGKGTWSVRLEAAQSREHEETDVVASASDVNSFDDALRMSNLITSWLRAQGL